MMKKARKISDSTVIFVNRFLRLCRGPVLDLSVGYLLGNMSALYDFICEIECIPLSHPQPESFFFHSSLLSHLNQRVSNM